MIRKKPTSKQFPACHPLWLLTSLSAASSAEKREITAGKDTAASNSPVQQAATGVVYQEYQGLHTHVRHTGRLDGHEAGAGVGSHARPRLPITASRLTSWDSARALRARLSAIINIISSENRRRRCWQSSTSCNSCWSRSGESLPVGSMTAHKGRCVGLRGFLQRWLQVPTTPAPPRPRQSDIKQTHTRTHTESIITCRSRRSSDGWLGVGLRICSVLFLSKPNRPSYKFIDLFQHR